MATPSKTDPNMLDPDRAEDDGITVSEFSKYREVPTTQSGVVPPQFDQERVSETPTIGAEDSHILKNGPEYDRPDPISGMGVMSVPDEGIGG